MDKKSSILQFALCCRAAASADFHHGQLVSWWCKLSLTRVQFSPRRKEIRQEAAMNAEDLLQVISFLAKSYFKITLAVATAPAKVQEISRTLASDFRLNDASIGEGAVGVPRPL